MPFIDVVVETIFSIVKIGVNGQSNIFALSWLLAAAMKEKLFNIFCSSGRSVVSTENIEKRDRRTFVYFFLVALICRRIISLYLQIETKAPNVGIRKIILMS